MIDEYNTKTCTKCGIEKELSEFHRSKNGRLGRASKCAKCSLINHAEYYAQNSSKIKERVNKYRLDNKEKIKKAKQKHYQKNKKRLLKKQVRYYADNREIVLENNKNYYSKNKESRNKYRRKYAQEHPQKEKGYRENYQNTHRDKVRAARAAYRSRNPNKTNEWRAANPDKAKAISQRRRANKCSVEINDFTADQWTQLKEKYNYQCVYCGCVSNKLTMDHIIPISRGGNHTLENILPACQQCNSKKGARTPEEAGMTFAIIINKEEAPTGK